MSKNLANCFLFMKTSLIAQDDHWPVNNVDLRVALQDKKVELVRIQIT